MMWTGPPLTEFCGSKVSLETPEQDLHLMRCGIQAETCTSLSEQQGQYSLRCSLYNFVRLSPSIYDDFLLILVRALSLAFLSLKPAGD